MTYDSGGLGRTPGPPLCVRPHCSEQADQAWREIVQAVGELCVLGGRQAAGITSEVHVALRFSRRRERDRDVFGEGRLRLAPRSLGEVGGYGSGRSQQLRVQVPVPQALRTQAACFRKLSRLRVDLKAM